MTRPQTLVEYGPGYSTLYLLAALAENGKDIREEEDSLRVKSHTLLRASGSEPFTREQLQQWYAAGGKACCVDPAFYLSPQAPHLFSFEDGAASAEYSVRLRETVEQLGLTPWFSPRNGGGFAADRLPASHQVIDFAFNDHRNYRQFFEDFWPQLNPSGGLMIFHNTEAHQHARDDISWMMEQTAAAGDMEVLTLPEPHKLDQSSCSILRRTTKYSPACETRTAAGIHTSIVEFAKRSETQ